MLPSATLESRVNIAAMLVDRGANLEANKQDGRTPLQYIDSPAHKERLLVRYRPGIHEYFLKFVWFVAGGSRSSASAYADKCNCKRGGRCIGRL
jgi:hypothetical protein